jgi:hypothetical protein
VIWGIEQKVPKPWFNCKKKPWLKIQFGEMPKASQPPKRNHGLRYNLGRLPELFLFMISLFFSSSHTASKEW